MTAAVLLAAPALAAVEPVESADADQTQVAAEASDAATQRMSLVSAMSERVSRSGAQRESLEVPRMRAPAVAAPAPAPVAEPAPAPAATAAPAPVAPTPTAAPAPPKPAAAPATPKAAPATPKAAAPAPKAAAPAPKAAAPAPKATPAPAPAPVTGLSSAPCASGSAVEAGLSAAAVRVHRAVCAKFPQISGYGGRTGSGGEHSAGRALDIMISGSVGTQIAEFVRANAGALGVTEVIWSQRIWTTQRSGEGWRSMSDRGSSTANHYDHVHVTL